MKKTVAWMSTNEFASECKVQPNTIRVGLCTNGHYLGIRPKKMPNGRLMWPADEVQQLLAEAPLK